MTLDVAGLAGDPALVRALRGLNNDHAVELSWLEDGRLETLVGRAFWAGRVGTVGMLIGFDQDASYESVNFQWFRGRFERFVYVDRVVVAGSARGRGVARGLYGAVMARAVAAGHERVVCEVNVEPPNEGSMRMHAGMGFMAVGAGDLGEKRVAYLARGWGRGDDLDRGAANEGVEIGPARGVAGVDGEDHAGFKEVDGGEKRRGG